ncbi:MULTISPECIES: bifunctional 3,4-dihydroxy-2-butanone-4-phosphate synthase/GTP cyclohydrolase II [unclassified Synechococcus]|uniref:bifunctional 3,4-dihydroxy-2-butanone-4-phosphate synthase/GTP cyclohydrolase II n=1 Tax=unclassified Synechococcus TaxID=2626047 RepID=UPI000AE8F48E|nr:MULTISPECIES: bifunctional 3,4-dihydroxy-2-butanone-4-phosphate synthase/GTP cyclohydrolase II [unclassified Synechococcus]
MDPNFDSIPDALNAIRNGECVVVVDDERRENEGDLICASQFATPEQINFMAKEARGLICLAIEGDRLDALDLPLMVDRNTDENQTAFTVSIDAGPEHGVSTGISAEDRSRTIQVVLQADAKPSDLRRPGHVFPLRARSGGVLKRAGHTEAAVDLAQLAGLIPSGVICEIQNSDGSMARLPELQIYAKQFGLRLISIADLISYRLQNERFVRRHAQCVMPSQFGQFQAVGFRNELDNSEHVALVKGVPGQLQEPVLVRMHSECLTGDAFGSLRCDCGPQLEAALSQIEQEGEGVVVYLKQEGRGIGLINKLKAYSLQDGGLDTVEANEKLGFGADLRNYGVGAQILSDLGIHRLRLLTNNPRKIAGLGGYGLEVVSRVPLIINPGDHNANYLATKRDKLGHLFNANSAADVVTLAWDCGEDLIAKLPDLLKRAEESASKLSLTLQPEQTPRLLALWERPQFVWTVSGDLTAIELFLKTLASWTETKRLGFLKTAKAEQRLHPSLQLNREEMDLSLLLDNTKNGWSGHSDQPILIHWS